MSRRTMAAMKLANRLMPVLVLLALCLAVATAPLSVAAQSSIFPLDVWTEKGGEGEGTYGGEYGVGELITIWVHIGLDSQMTWTTAGPGGSETNSTYIPAGTYSMDLGVAESSDIGFWTFSVQAMSGSIVAMDEVEFRVIDAEVPTTIPPTVTPQPTTAPGLVAISADSATARDALMALQMAAGSLPVDLGFDVDDDGQVSIEDARIILRWAVS